MLLDGARHGAALGVGAATSGSAKTGPAICARTVEVSTVAEGALAEWLSRAARPLLLRAKGLVALEDGSTRLLQLVGNRWSLDTCELSARTTTGRLALLALDEATLDAVAADLSALGVQRQS